MASIFFKQAVAHACDPMRGNRRDNATHFPPALGFCLPENAKKGCRLELWTHPSILPDGRLSACAAYPVPVGDLMKEHIRDILKRRDPAVFAAAAGCPGCVRGDLPLYDLFLGKPWHQISPRDVLKLLNA